MSLDSLEERKTKYEPMQTSLLDIYRAPTKNPLATIAATIIGGAIISRANLAAQTHAWWVGVLMIGVGYLAYRIAKLDWQVKNDFVATELVKRPRRHLR